MNKGMTTLAALLSGVMVCNVQPAAAQANPPPDTTATRPAKTTSPSQTSAPNDAAPATINQPTGATNQDPTVKKMNEDEKQKVDTKGK
ncbi:MAG: hypothetical protein Q8M05_10235 [Rhodoferax sp.]|uniref:hypothetical protein n=1 Tax=Rhodoferax sp. TaxID=50421 RepID=UPI00272F2410|nr:hypothetical protein [Rhodoferax sp.]MDP1529745.1 hypothetical protein [Rhodoferax sp.]